MSGVPRVKPGTGGLDAAAAAGVIRQMYVNYLKEHPDADLRGEYGWHRLIWISPFDTHSRRQTVFVWVGDADSPDVLVRTYVLQPYTAATNSRDEGEVADVHSVLSGQRLGELL